MRITAALALVGGALCALAQSLNSSFGVGDAVCSANPPSTVFVTKEIIVFKSMTAANTALSFTLPSSSGVYYFSVENGTTAWYDGISPSVTAPTVLQTSTIEVTEVPASSTMGMARITTQIITATEVVTSTVTPSTDEAARSTGPPTTVTILSTTTQNALVILALPSVTAAISNITSINTTSTQANETTLVTEMKQVTHTRIRHPAFSHPILGWNFTSSPYFPPVFNNTTLLTVFNSINEPNMTLAYSTAA